MLMSYEKHVIKNILKPIYNTRGMDDTYLIELLENEYQCKPLDLLDDVRANEMEPVLTSQELDNDWEAENYKKCYF